MTQSTNNGPGDAGRETSTVSAAAIIQYAVGVQTAVTRMTLSGIDGLNLEFNAPSNFDDCTSPSVCVFHLAGGGAGYQLAPPDIIESGVLSGLSLNGWIYSSHYAVQDVGTAEPETMAFLGGLTETQCRQINERLGNGDIAPFENSTSGVAFLYDANFNSPSLYQDNNYSQPVSLDLGFILGGGSILPVLSGRLEGCYIAGFPNVSIYYKVLIAR